nr:hypothetical protein [Tanacetum cinerariifolium]
VYAEETRDEESFDHIPQTPKNNDDEGNGEEDLGLNVGGEEGHVEEDEEDKLYRDVNINQGRGIQANLEVEDSHVTLTLVNPDGQQQSSSLSSQFVTSMLNPTLNAGMESIFETTSQMDVQTPTTVAPLPMTVPTMTPSTIATITTTSQAPNLPTTVPSTIIQNLPNFTSLIRFDDRLRSLEANFSEFTQTNQFARASDRLRDEAQRENDEFLKTVDKNMQKIIKEQALVEAYESDKIILDTYEEIVTLKRCRDDDADKDKEPFVGPDQGLKRRREGKEPESASAPTETATRSAVRSTQGSRSRQASVSESALAEEPMQTTSQMEEPSHLEFDTGAEDQPIVQSTQHPEWFSQQQKPPSPDRDWNRTVSTVHESIQPWISELAKQTDSRSSFNEHMDTPLDFSNFLINRLKTKATDYGHIKWIEDLVPRTMWIEEPIGYDKHALYGVSHWGRKRQQFYDFDVNWESARDVYSKRRIIAVTELKIEEWHSYEHLDWITRRVKDLQLGVESYQKKLDLTKPDSYRSDLKHKEAYTTYSNPRGFIYQSKDKKNRLIQIDELHKFSDGTLTDVRTALDNCLKGIRMQYLPQLIRRKSEKDRAAAMIQAIDKRLKTRRIMRSFERFVGGRLYEGNLRMLQRTI